MGEVPGCLRPCVACVRAVSSWLGEGWRERVTQGAGEECLACRRASICAMGTLLPKLAMCATLCDSLFYTYNI